MIRFIHRDMNIYSYIFKLELSKMKRKVQLMKDIHVSRETLHKCIDKMFEPNKDFYRYLNVKKKKVKDDSNKKNVTKI